MCDIVLATIKTFIFKILLDLQANLILQPELMQELPPSLSLSLWLS